MEAIKQYHQCALWDNEYEWDTGVVGEEEEEKQKTLVPEKEGGSKEPKEKKETQRPTQWG